MMASFMKECKHLEVQLEDIKSATNGFDKKYVIGNGGFGMVYRGEMSLSRSETKSLVALKRLDRQLGQDDPEFYKEIRMLSCYRHENLISLLGFCNQGGEMVLVYEYASGGSLDRYLSSATLTWGQRLIICLGAAKGLSFLHDPNGTHQRVLHCDIKSANILLDKNMNAKVADFGLSKIGPANQNYSLLFTNAVGTPGYCDPEFMKTYTLRKESDVYSFGVVLFEVLCGKFCIEICNGKRCDSVPSWKQRYTENRLDEIIFKDLKEQMDPRSLEIFSGIAYQCVSTSHSERPLMSDVVEKLENALELHEKRDTFAKVPKEYVKILKAAVDPMIDTPLEKLKELLYKGIFLNDRKTFFSINDKGQHCERIYIEGCLDRNEIIAGGLQLLSDHSSRFPGGLSYSYVKKFKACVKAEFLSPTIRYTVNLVFKYKTCDRKYMPLRYSFKGEKKVTIVDDKDKREDGWFMAELFEVTSDHSYVDLEITFEENLYHLDVAGIEFQPLDNKEKQGQVLEYLEIRKAASRTLHYTSLEELKAHLSKGVHLNGHKTWFSLDEDGKHCEMISIQDCMTHNRGEYNYHHFSRFPAGMYESQENGYKICLKAQFLSPSTDYTINLVFYNPNFNKKEVYIGLKYKFGWEDTANRFAFLANKREDDCLYMAELCQFCSDGSTFDLEIELANMRHDIKLEGILFQPLETVVDMQTESYSETCSSIRSIVQWRIKDRFYLVLAKCFNIDIGQEWLYLDKNGRKGRILSSMAVLTTTDFAAPYSPESRFGVVLQMVYSNDFSISKKIEPEDVSPETRYATYLVYKLPHKSSRSTLYNFEIPLEVQFNNGGDSSDSWYIYLESPRSTAITGQEVYENPNNPLNRTNLKSSPRQRGNGWLEVQVWEFQTQSTRNTIYMHLKFIKKPQMSLEGLMLQGIEIRPI